MAETRTLDLSEKTALLCALASARSEAYETAAEHHRRAYELDAKGNKTHRGVCHEDEESKAYEAMGDVLDELIHLTVEGKLGIIDYGKGENCDDE